MSDEYNIDELPDGGFNFGVVNKKANSLDDYKINSQITKKVIPNAQLVYKEDSGYGVYDCQDEEKNDIKVSGVFLNPLTVGQTYEVMGKVISYRGERQLQSEVVKNVRPVNMTGIVSYLKTLRGIDEIKANLIYEIFGDQSLDVLSTNPMKVANEIKGIGKKSVESWQEQLEKLKDNQQTMTVLLSYGLTVKQAKFLFDIYKEGIVYKIEQNPYMLSGELDGFSFSKCDAIAHEMGYDPKGMFRIQEGIMNILKDSSFEGNCYLPLSEIVRLTKELLDIKLGVLEMKKILSDHKEDKDFKYSYGQYSYEVNYNELYNIYKAYYNESNTANRENFRYTLVAIDKTDILKELDNLAQVNKIIYEDNKIYLPQIYEAEKKVAELISELNKTATNNFSNVEEDLEELCKEKNIILEEKQKEAVIEFNRGKGGFYILNGSAGCGKTFTLNIILEILEKQYKKEGYNCKIKVFAPTGKASKVASKATGRDCITVHRGLKFNPQKGFEHNENLPIEADCIVVDESSMLDVQLTRSLLVAVDDNTKVIFLGDTKQLPSVGAGNILHDIINSEAVKIVTLNVVKRQGKESGIVRNANNIINTRMISSCKDTKDAYVIKTDTPTNAQNRILKSIHEIIRGFNYPMEDIQVLCPQKTSLVGTDVMNYMIQQEFNKEDDGITVLNKRIKILNPETNEEERVNLYFKKGDKVIHMKNNYSMPWYFKGQYWGYQEDLEFVGITNGEMGVIEEIVKEESFDKVKTRIIVRYDDKYVFYDDNFSELEHAYALTIHKSQGSQWKAVIIPLMKQNFNMLDNNLFYTGYTRAQKFCVVVGQEDAIAYAIRTHKSRERYTGLAEMLKSIS
ncbi:MAG: hypothetical protein K0R54_204 [Clostridiaceae bacterium]|jgi:exodeoxyribonuclease V alpha subunit|nr:hypothetical protein [Clostridiaceae bacterium]